MFSDHNEIKSEINKINNNRDDIAIDSLDMKRVMKMSWVAVEWWNLDEMAEFL